MVISCTVKLKKDSFQLLLHAGKNVSIVDSGMHMTQLPNFGPFLGASPI
jgi:hypothetical protein